MSTEKPLTREDVLKLIEANGGTAKGLDLSRRNLQGIDLSRLDLKSISLNGAALTGAKLHGAILTEAGLQGADLRGADLSHIYGRAITLEDARLQGDSLRLAVLSEANLKGTDLQGADLRRAALREANFERASLLSADVRGADLSLANFRGAVLWGAIPEGAFLGATNLQGTLLEGVRWGRRHSFLGPQYKVGEETIGKWLEAELTYRSLRRLHAEQGMYDRAGDFFFREMTVKRKQMKLWSLSRAWSKLVSLICGYGEIPERTVAWGACWLLGLALVYWLLQAVYPFTLTAEGFLASLYYSSVSFTSLGYGPWFLADSVRGWAQGVGAFESLMGAFTIALFLVTFTRKMTR